MSNENQRICAMATFPPRLEGSILVIQKLLPQCDKFYCYLNGYTELPPGFPQDPKLVTVLAGPGCEHQDLGSQGKFFWCGVENGYYLTVDDDIHYPEGYVDYMVNNVDRYSRKAIVGMHGGLFRIRMGGGFPERGMAKEHRTLYPYDTAVPRDMSVHILGAGVMACYPTAIGLTRDACCGPVHSGDDEDIAIWSQRKHIPLVRLQGRTKWILPNNLVWIKDPLHRRVGYMQAADTKLKQWKQWTVQRLPEALPDLTQAKAITVQAAVVTPKGPQFSDIRLNPADLEFCHKILSSDALAAILVDRIKTRTPTSVIRMSDGERAFIEHAKGAAPAPFMLDRQWLQRYGLTNADLKRVGLDLLEAGNRADFLACTISGLYYPGFKVHQHFPERKQFIDSFFGPLWEATGRVADILRAGPVLVLHRDYARLVPILQRKYQVPKISGMSLNSWGDHDRLLRELPAHEATTVLVSGGASGKPFCVRLAEQAGKVAIDAGESTGTIWAK